VEPEATFLNPDGSALKVFAPRDLGPTGSSTVDSVRPTLGFTSAVGRLQVVPLAHEVEVANSSGTVVYARLLAESQGSANHTLEEDLTFGDTFIWRVRARLGEQAGPWSDAATFRTPDRSTPVAGGGPNALPFPVPGQCGPGDPSNRVGCAAAIAALSAEWGRCASGSGVGCHRFTRQVAFALSRFDPGWKMIVAGPGGHACNCGGCGPSDGTMLREDTVVYNGNQVFDMITGAGGPSPGITWSRVPGPRPTDFPADAPLCAP
jgi:hypothetical protein